MWTAFAMLVAAESPFVVAEEPLVDRRAAVLVRAVHPDRQAEAVIHLFDGSRAAHPAAAMAAWRRATSDISQVSKPLQAVAALFNPQMAAEWKAFDGAELSLAFHPTDGQPLWRVIVPEDDGAIAALVTALRLSGGADVPPIADPPVDVERLGGPGAAVAARLPEGVAFASRRDELAEAVAILRARREGVADPEPSPPGLDGPGFRLTVDPEKLAPAGASNPTLLRIATAARAGGGKTIDALLALDDDHLDLKLSTRLDPGSLAFAGDKPAALDPSWLACVPLQGAQAAVAIALGRGAGCWDRLFDAADRVDRADPSRAQLAPLRTRLNLLAVARGIRIEADLWPLLRGVTAAAFVHPEHPGRTGGALLALHTDRPDDAERILRRVVAPLASWLGGPRPDASAKTLALGRLSGRPVEATAKESTVLVGWGDGALESSLRSIERPEESAAAILKAGADDRVLNRAGVYWPGRLDLPIKGYDVASPLAAVLSEGPPVVWRGGEEGGRAWDLVRWPDLQRLVARFLDHVPQAPPERP